MIGGSTVKEAGVKTVCPSLVVEFGLVVEEMDTLSSA
jgi:hypothetical protein